MDLRVLSGRALAFGVVASVWLPFAACSSGGSDLFTSPLGDAGDAGSGADATGGVGTGGVTGKGGAAAQGGQKNPGTPSGGSVGDAGAVGSGGSSTAGSPGRGGSAGAKSAQGGSIGAGSCDYAGETYADGDSFPSSDGCNTCFCDSGSVGCTQRACAPLPSTCEELGAAIEAELQSIQACEKDAECGQVLTGTSCGCTRDLVARLDADASRFEMLSKTTVNGELCTPFGSTCDCPEADGFVCDNSRCAWNYTARTSCQSVPAGSVCILGNPIGSGEQLAVGDTLHVSVQPSGCFSSSCTATDVASCSIAAASDAFTVTSEFCARDVSEQGGGCTDDCGGVDSAQCEASTELVAGEHTLKFGGKSLTFQVPGVILSGENCIELEQP